MCLNNTLRHSAGNSGALDKVAEASRSDQVAARRVLPQDGPALQILVALKLQLDLVEEFVRGRPVVAEDGDRHLGVVQHLLDHPGESDDGRLVVLPRSSRSGP